MSSCEQAFCFMILFYQFINLFFTNFDFFKFCFNLLVWMYREIKISISVNCLQRGNFLIFRLHLIFQTNFVSQESRYHILCQKLQRVQCIDLSLWQNKYVVLHSCFQANVYEEIDFLIYNFTKNRQLIHRVVKLNKHLNYDGTYYPSNNFFQKPKFSNHFIPLIG